MQKKKHAKIEQRSAAAALQRKEEAKIGSSEQQKRRIYGLYIYILIIILFRQLNTFFWSVKERQTYAAITIWWQFVRAAVDNLRNEKFCFMPLHI